MGLERRKGLQQVRRPRMTVFLYVVKAGMKEADGKPRRSRKRAGVDVRQRRSHPYGNLDEDADEKVSSPSGERKKGF